MADGTIRASAKVCSKCGEMKLATSEFFGSWTTGNCGLRPRCKVCCASITRAYRRANPDKFCGYERARCAKVTYKARRREYLKGRRTVESNRLHYERHRTKILARGKGYYRANLERLREKARLKREKTSERLREYQRAYRERHPDRVRSSRQRLRERSARDPKWRTGKAISSSLLKALRHRKDGAYWELLVGYGRAELVRHLERQFSRGMSWENFGSAWHIDHVLPVASFTFASAYDPEVKACWALGNLRPLWKRDNLSKHAKRTHLI